MRPNCEGILGSFERRWGIGDKMFYFAYKELTAFVIVPHIFSSMTSKHCHWSFQKEKKKAPVCKPGKKGEREKSPWSQMNSLQEGGFPKMEPWRGQTSKLAWEGVEFRGQGQTLEDNTGSDYREYRMSYNKSVRAGTRSYDRFFTGTYRGCFMEKCRWVGTMCACSTPSQQPLSRRDTGVCGRPPWVMWAAAAPWNWLLWVAKEWDEAMIHAATQTSLYQSPWEKFCLTSIPTTAVFLLHNVSFLFYGQCGISADDSCPLLLLTEIT